MNKVNAPTKTPVKGNRPPKAVGDPPRTKIKETVVADPSISFTIDLPEDLPESSGYLVLNFKAKIYLTDVPGVHDGPFTHIATVKVKSLTSRSVYIYVPFGDPNYQPGQSFSFKLKLYGESPVTGQPIVFNDAGNIFFQDLIGGGIVTDHSIPIIPPVKTPKKKTSKK
jgi:hypothetical protein